MLIFAWSEAINQSWFKELDIICEEICSMSHGAQVFMYCNNSATNQIHDASPESHDHTKIIQEMISDYIVFEKTYMGQCIKQLFEEDEESYMNDIKKAFDSEEVITWQLSGYVFFIYQKSMVRVSS